MSLPLSIVSVQDPPWLYFKPLKLLNIDFNADPDPAFHSNADLDPAFHSSADPDPAFQSNADPDPASKNYADPCGTGSFAKLATPPPKVMRICNTGLPY
jgi:hypothetical protein